MSENPLFRKAALDKLASPERLDVLMQVTSPMGWLALTTVGGILVGVIVWSILGSIPERIDGQGVLLRGGANKEIRSTGSGTLATLDLKEGQMITVGQVLGTISAAGNNEEVNVARTKVQQLEQQRLTSNVDAGQNVAAAQAQIARLRGDLDLKRLDLQRAQAEVARLEPLFKDGGITAQRMEGARSAGQRRAIRSSPASTARSPPRRTAPARPAPAAPASTPRSRSPAPSCSACSPASARRSR